METLITSRQNPTAKLVHKLWNRRQRDKSGLFLIEGYRELSRAVAGGVEFETLLYAPSLFLGENEPDLIASIDAQRLECSESLFRSLSYRDRPDGLLAIAKQRHFGLSSLPLEEAPFFVVAEAIEKPGNLGTILRSADGSGVDGVIVCDRCTDVHNPNVVRASVGTLFTVPTVEARGEETLAWLKENGIAVVAATPSAEANFTDVDLTKGVAIVVGTEQVGLSKRWMEAADIQVKIPMLGEADSLNVAVATTLLLYETVRQRQ